MSANYLRCYDQIIRPRTNRFSELQVYGTPSARFKAACFTNLTWRKFADKAVVGGTERRTQKKPAEEAKREGYFKEQSADTATQQRILKDPSQRPPSSCHVQLNQEKQQPSLLPPYTQGASALLSALYTYTNCFV